MRAQEIQEGKVGEAIPLSFLQIQREGDTWNRYGNR